MGDLKGVKCGTKVGVACDMPELRIQPVRQHIVLILPESASREHIPSIILFLTQIINEGHSAGKQIYLTLQFLSDKTETPIELKLISGAHIEEVVAQIINRHLQKFFKDDRFVSVVPNQMSTEASQFNWKQLADTFRKEEKLIPRDVADDVHRTVFLFQTKGVKASAPSKDADLYTVELSDDKATYPMAVTPVPFHRETPQNLEFPALSPCEMHERFVKVFGEYDKKFGRAPLQRLSESFEPQRSFSLTHALNALKTASYNMFDAAKCSAHMAFNTAETSTAYAGPLRSWHLNTLGKGDPIFDSLALFSGENNSLPEQEDAVGEAAGYYELLTQTAKMGDDDAPAYFLHHTFRIIYESASFRSRDVQPDFKKTLSQYLSNMNATPGHFFKALYDHASPPSVRGEYIPWDYFPKTLSHFAEIFRPLSENFQKLPRGKQMEVVGNVLGYLRRELPNILYQGESPIDLQRLLIALDTMYSAVENDPLLKKKFADGVVAELTHIQPDKIENKTGSGVHSFILFLTQKAALDSDHARRIVEWAVGLKDIEKHQNKASEETVAHVLELVWPLVADSDKEYLRGKAATFLLETMQKRRAYIDKDGNAFGHASFDHTSELFGVVENGIDHSFGLPKVVIKILNVENMTQVIVGLLNDPAMRTVPKDFRHVIYPQYIEQTILPTLTFARWNLDEATWCKLVSGIMSGTKEAWRIVPYILIHSKNSPFKKEIFEIVYRNTLKPEGLFLNLRAWERSDSAYHIWKMVEAVRNEDLDGLIRIYRENTDKINDLMKGDFFSEGLKKKILSYVFLRPIEIARDKRLFSLLIKPMMTGKSAVPAAYDNAIHGVPLDKAIDRVMTEIEKDGSKDEKYRRSLNNYIYAVFDMAPIQKKKDIVASLTRRIQTLSGRPLQVALDVFAEVIAQVDSAEVIVPTKVLFPWIAKDIHSKEDVQYRFFIETFLKKWEELLPKIPFDVQCEVYIQLVGPLAPLAVSILSLGLIADTIIGNEKSGQNKEKARLLGQAIARSPYAGLVAQVIWSNLTQRGFEGILEGFTETALTQEQQILKEKDIRQFIKSGFFAYWRAYPNEYKVFVRNYLKMSMTDDMIVTVLSPARNDFLHLFKTTPGSREYREILRRLRPGFEMMIEILNDVSIPLAHRQYTFLCLKQLVTDTVAANEPSLEGFMGQAREVLKNPVGPPPPELRSLLSQVTTIHN